RRQDATPFTCEKTEEYTLTSPYPLARTFGPAFPSSRPERPDPRKNTTTRELTVVQASYLGKWAHALTPSTPRPGRSRPQEPKPFTPDPSTPYRTRTHGNPWPFTPAVPAASGHHRTPSQCPGPDTRSPLGSRPVQAQEPPTPTPASS